MLRRFQERISQTQKSRGPGDLRQRNSVEEPPKEGKSDDVFLRARPGTSSLSADDRDIAVYEYT